MNQSKRGSSDKDNNENTIKSVNYKDYLVLRNSYVQLGEKYKKLKETLKDYQNQISQFQQTKNNISDMVKQINTKIAKKKINN